MSYTLMIKMLTLLSLAAPLTAQAMAPQTDLAKPEDGKPAPKLKLPAIIGDNMVLQRDRKVPLWGWAAPGEAVQVSMNGRSASATADAQGRWMVEIGPFPAGGPFEMRIFAPSGDKSVRNVAVGEVWLCAGQSNMEMQVGPSGYGKGVQNAAVEVAAANYPMLRMLTVKRHASSAPVDDVEGSWKFATPENVGAFSATGYFFGRDLHKALNVPVGLLNASWGMMFIESFTSRETIASNPESKGSIANDDAKVRDFYAKVNQFVEDLKKWKEESALAEAEGAVVPPPPVMPEDYRNSPFRMSTIYNGMIAPLTPFGARGAIWYQGESNTIGPEGYTASQTNLIRDWRRAFRRDDFAFLFVQLPNFVPGHNMFITEDSWARFREAQAKTLAITNTGMAITIDVGDPVNIHPENKQDVGHRLALAALGNIYGRKIVFSGPIYDSMKVRDGRARLAFKHTGSGLAAKTEDGSFSTDAPLKWFTIAGADRKFVPAQARIEGNEVVVWADEVQTPEAVRYAWTNNPEGCNLYNNEKLPASPFRTDDWKRETVK